MPFKKGHSGYRKGAKGKKTEQWEAIGEAISGKHAASFNSLMDELWTSGSRDNKLLAADLYLKTLEYFKPKQARQETIHSGDIGLSTIRFEDAEGSKD